jgi:acetate kinase
MSGWILAVNCGSSSIKGALFDARGTDVPRQPDWREAVTGIATGAARNDGEGLVAIPAVAGGSYHAAVAQMRDRVLQHLGTAPLLAVAHRVVHGAGRYEHPVLVDERVLADLKSYVPLAPLHQPFALDAIETWLRLDPRIPQVACFDTAFHHTLPQVERMLPLSWDAWESGLRRYGFHGLSYEYLAQALHERYGERANGRTIVAHLGSGASLCAMRDLRSVATTMGFSALDGLMMGTRCGALDPGALLHLMETHALNTTQAADLLYRASGLLGISGTSADPRELLALESRNDDRGERARAALALYVRRIIHEIGGLVAALGGLDLLAFSAGIGENNAEIRARICRDLAFFGVSIDAAANAANAPLISTSDSRVAVAVEPTNEEWIAARAARHLGSTRGRDTAFGPSA